MSETVLSTANTDYDDGAWIRRTIHEVFDDFADNDRFLLKEIIVVDARSGDNTGEHLSA